MCWRDTQKREDLEEVATSGVLDMVRKRQEEWKGRLDEIGKGRCMHKEIIRRSGGRKKAERIEDLD